jgi:hypothetical protein
MSGFPMILLDMSRDDDLAPCSPGKRVDGRVPIVELPVGPPVITANLAVALLRLLRKAAARQELPIPDNEATKPLAS